MLGLDLGADDYVVKPVDLHELAARLRALVRRSHGQPQEVLRLADIELDPAAHIRAQGEPALATARPRVRPAARADAQCRDACSCASSFSKHLYSWGREVESNVRGRSTFTTCAASSAPTLIHTVRGVGYTMLRGAPAC